MLDSNTNSGLSDSRGHALNHKIIASDRFFVVVRVEGAARPEMGKNLKEKLLGVGNVKVHDLGVVKLVSGWVLEI